MPTRSTRPNTCLPKQLHAPVKETVRYRASFVNQAQALWSDLRHGLERPRSLQFWTAVLHTLFLLSIISAVIMRFEFGSGTEGTSRWTSISWIIMPAEWPAFFQPTAVEIADGQLFVVPQMMWCKNSSGPRRASRQWDKPWQCPEQQEASAWWMDS